MAAPQPVIQGCAECATPTYDPDTLDAAISGRAKNIPASPVRALLSMHRDHDTLDLGGGIPDMALFPSETLAEITARVVRDNAAQALQYAPTEGLWPLREFIAHRLNQRGCKLTADEIIITHGAQQALATVAALLTGPGQPLLLEQPGYPGALQAFSLAQAPLLSLPITTDGWDLEAVRARHAAAAYVIPTFQNPTGRRAGESARIELTRWLDQRRICLIEDDAYGELAFDGSPTRPLLADAEGRGILLGTFSKTLCPGMRVGWIAAPKSLISSSVRLLQAASLQPGTLSQYLAWELIQTLDWSRHVARLSNAYRARAQALRARCQELGLESAMPQGGLFLWVTSPGQATAFAASAAARGVFCVPESGFRAFGQPAPDAHLRLAFSRYLDLPAQREKLRHAFAVTREPMS
jgi:2-aminoadipate transaminase